MTDLLKHKIEMPKKEGYASRTIVEDGAVFTGTTPQQWTIAVAGYSTVYLRILTATSNGTLATRLCRTNSDEYPVGFSTADTAVVAGTAQQVSVACKGVKEIVVRFTPAASGTFTYLDVGFEGY